MHPHSADRHQKSNIKCEKKSWCGKIKVAPKTTLKTNQNGKSVQAILEIDGVILHFNKARFEGLKSGKWRTFQSNHGISFMRRKRSSRNQDGQGSRVHFDALGILGFG